MAPANPRKRKSDQMEEPASPAAAATPTGSPRKKMRITQSQKQALMDNLQLEITERARQLRAEYALQCADLRTRLERRVHRIPLSFRNMKMGELAAQHESAKAQASKHTSSPPKPQRNNNTKPGKDRPLPALPEEQQKIPSPARQAPQLSPLRGRKRMSSEIQIASDKENQVEQDNIPVIKNTKRGKAAPVNATNGAARQASRSAKTASVLSPRSHNSRTLPRSPIKEFNTTMAPGSLAKSFIARPVSPLKPASPFKSAATAATSAISASVHGMIEQAKRGTAGRMGRTASKDKATTKASTTTTATASSPRKMLPPPRPAANTQQPPSPQRAISQSSVHSSATDMSTTSTNTTVVKPKRGAARTATKSSAAKIAEQKSPATGVAKRGVAKAASAAKSALKKNATTTTKKAMAPEPAAGRRILRKRT
ncbi:hypothetical protein PV10_06644 [Exophiala mesophila]|uniref:Borealin N-terminal domain-containing protein n=1 Tax=Exophiala mesophila TaxID=212818 RepID=A0A0D1WSM5_EXOME|nr:uncharacterized protein PV10_06644 [Exophiala mesophila]KIV92185.1 hypothetical protein PV10_06644 [Exophiala mesophila]